MTANSLAELANVEVVKLTNPLLVSILNAIAGPAGLGNVFGKGLVAIEGVKGTAAVTLDGQNSAQQTASGSLVDVRILGKSLKDLVPGLSLDQILPPGTNCVIRIPGGITGCPGLGALSIIPSLGPSLDGLVTVTLTRGTGVFDPNASATEGSASIVTLEVTANLDCTKIPALSTLNQTLGALPVKISLCPGPAQGSNTTRGARAVAVSPQLLDVRLGVANAALSLTPGTIPNTPSSPPRPPNTGSNVWILAVLAALVAMAGVGLQVFRARPVRA